MNIYNYILLIGEKGPIILLFLSIYFLRHRQTYLYFYILGYIICVVLNTILKGIFLQPRPYYDEDIFKIYMHNHVKKYKNAVGLPFEDFGMPSGHSQCVLYSTAFVYFVLKNNKILLLYLLISFITLFQRVKNLHHTIFQVFIGTFIGVVLGYFMYYYSNKLLQGNLMIKKDDYAFVL